MKTQTLLSIVIPAYNESAGIKEFHKNILLPNVPANIGDSFEFIYVDEGSTDDIYSLFS